MPKVALKTSSLGSTGFSLEKFELTPDCKMTVETALSGVAPGLKFEFKGNDSDKSDMFLTYKTSQATITADVDVYNFSSAKASVNSGHGPFTAGASVDLKIAKSIASTTCGFGIGYTLPKVMFAGIRANKNFTSYSALCEYSAIKNVALAGSATYASGTTTAAIAGSYAPHPCTTMKFKATSAGTMCASVKQSLDKKFCVVASAEVPVSSLKSVKFGVNATLG